MPDRKHVTLIARLNDDLAHAYAAAIRFRTYASLLQGPHRPVLRRLFAEHAAAELAHAALLADRIAALGGLPTVGVAPVELETEPEAMLRRLTHAGATAVERYANRRRLAAELGEHGLAVELDALVADETRRRDELARLLAGRWPAPDAGTFEQPHGEDRDRGAPAHRLVASAAAAYAGAGPEPGDGGGSGGGILGD